MINYGKHFIDNKDIISVKKVLKSDWLTQGPIVKKFESSLNFFFIYLRFKFFGEHFEALDLINVCSSCSLIIARALDVDNLVVLGLYFVCLRHGILVHLQRYSVVH